MVRLSAALIGLAVAAFGFANAAHAQTSWLLRPVEVIVQELTGSVQTGSKPGAMAPVSKGSKFVAAGYVSVPRRARLEVEFPHVARAKLGPETELKIEEFLQAPVSLSAAKSVGGPEPSATKISVVLSRGEISFSLRELAIERGSSFAIETDAGVLSANSGVFSVRAEKSEKGFALVTVKVTSGDVRFEPLGEKSAAVLSGTQKMYSVEPTAAGRAVRVREFSGKP